MAATMDTDKGRGDQPITVGSLLTTLDLKIWSNVDSPCRREFEQRHPGLDPVQDREARSLWMEFLTPAKQLVSSLTDPGREPSCLTCRDAGWVYYHVPKEHPNFGKASPCPNPDCDPDREWRAQRRMEQSGIPDTKREVGFASFKRRTGTEAALEAAQLFSGGQAPYWLLLLYGGPGCGKSHLVYSVGLEWLKRGRWVLLRYAPKLFEDLRAAIKDDQLESRMYELINCDLLVIDDLHVEQGTPWQAETVERIVHERYENRRALIVTTNSDIKALNPALLSRFQDGEASRMVLNTATDYRKQLKAKEG